jgi:hypothetical protein
MMTLVAVLACSLAGEAETAKAETSKSTVSIVRAAVSGPLEGDAGEFFVLLEGFSFKADDERGTAVVADAFFGSVECTTTDSVAEVRFSGLTRATVEGTVTGECFDLETETASSYRAELIVEWRGLGRVTNERFEDESCAHKISSRDSTARGSFTWAAPELGLSGSAASIVATELVELRDRCRTT